ncbi:RNA polymerase sigma-70 factor [Marinobacter nitratireducens]|uniref:RNA polymerase sigma-70 factor n=1 Tax=Marinobacter nitratireducens TaxID=1137280 RepID=A0A072N0X5_9GAMM|nr:RNA polymerase sigma factor SigJ [Marinobacter nitratireducens]KEF31334.1 RNA polymerase sigma-70 factor [Marinobacter nitratireducens]
MTQGDDLDVFEAHRTQLFSMVYRMLGSISEAEDVVQETYLRFHQQPKSTISNPAGWLTSVAMRVALDQLRLAYRHREQYVGDWLPEPLIVDNNPEQEKLLSQSLTMAFLHMMERLNPRERAVFILRKAFDWSYREIAATVGINEAAGRQLYRRSLGKMEGVDLTPSTTRDDMHLFDEFMATCASGDFTALAGKLAADVTVYSDSNGQERALRRPIFGNERVAHFLLRLLKNQPDGVRLEKRLLNSEPGLLVLDGQRVVTALVFSFRSGKLWRLYSIRNPEKLTALASE